MEDEDWGDIEIKEETLSLIMRLPSQDAKSGSEVGALINYVANQVLTLQFRMKTTIGM